MRFSKYLSAFAAASLAVAPAMASADPITPHSLGSSARASDHGDKHSSDLLGGGLIVAVIAAAAVIVGVVVVADNKNNGTPKSP